MTASRLLSSAAVALATMAPMGANATVVATISEVGGDVLVTYSGSIDLTGFGSPSATQGANSSDIFASGPALRNWSSDYVFYAFSGAGSVFDTAIGSGPAKTTPTDSGDVFGIGGNLAEDRLYLPDGYTTGTPLNGSITFTGDDFTSLGLIPGTYTYNFGPATSGVSTETVTVDIVAPVPVPAGLPMFAVGLLGAAAWLRRRRTA